MEKTILDIICDTPIVVGTATKHREDPLYSDTRRSNFNMYTHEWSLKWKHVSPKPSQVHINKDAQAIIDAINNDNKKFKGHCILWHNDLPDWFHALGVQEKQTAMLNHVKSMMQMFKGKVYKWDVVNEAIADSTNDLRPMWKEVGGIDFIDKVFRVAHEVDPECTLVYNDYACTKINNKSNAIFNMLKTLKERGCPIHEVGLQTHEDGACMRHMWMESMKQNIARFYSIGLTSTISELDIRCHTFAGSLDEKLEKQADVYYRFFKAALSDLRACNEITLWNFTGKYTWVYDFFKVEPMYCPLPWDNDIKPTASYQAIKRALQEVVDGLMG